MATKKTKKTSESHPKQSMIYSIPPSSEETVWQDKDGLWWVTPKQKPLMIVEDYLMYPQPKSGQSQKLNDLKKKENI